jgi:tryptophan-rich sensory protein
MRTSRRSGLEPRWALLVAVACVVLAASAGQVLAGDDPRARLEELDTTTITLPFAAWIVVGVAYYALVYRLARRLPSSTSAFVSVTCVLVANEVWNALLFGFDSVAPAAIGMLVFAAITMVAASSTFRVDRVSGWLLCPYVIWVVGYDEPWILWVWSHDGS